MSSGRCSPAEMRKNLVIVGELKKAGLDFVAVPVKDAAHKASLLSMADEIFDQLLEIQLKET